MESLEKERKMNETEIKAFKARLEHLKSEIESLKKSKEMLQTEIESSKARHNQEIENRYGSARQDAEKIAEERKKLESSKEQFESLLNEFKKEKTATEREKQTALDMKNDAQKLFDKCAEFIRLVREGSSKL